MRARFKPVSAWRGTGKTCAERAPRTLLAPYVIRLFASGGFAAKYRLMPFMMASAIWSR